MTGSHGHTSYSPLDYFGLIHATAHRYIHSFELISFPSVLHAYSLRLRLVTTFLYYCFFYCCNLHYVYYLQLHTSSSSFEIFCYSSTECLETGKLLDNCTTW